MESAKEKAIREAYGEHWEDCKNKIDSQGYLECYEFTPSLRMISDLRFEGKVNNPYKFRPKSLQGIENNNGWTLIESEADLPPNGTYIVVFKNEAIGESIKFTGNDDFWINHITHYQPVSKPQPPIY